MLVTLTEFTNAARDGAGNVLPLGGGRKSCHCLDANGSFPALDDETTMVRIATDTAIQMDIAGGETDTDDELFLPGIEFIAVGGGEVLTIQAVV